MSLDVPFCSQDLCQVKSMMKLAKINVFEERLAREQPTLFHASWVLGQSSVTIHNTTMGLKENEI